MTSCHAEHFHSFVHQCFINDSSFIGLASRQRNTVLRRQQQIYTTDIFTTACQPFYCEQNIIRINYVA